MLAEIKLCADRAQLLLQVQLAEKGDKATAPTTTLVSLNLAHLGGQHLGARPTQEVLQWLEDVPILRDLPHLLQLGLEIPEHDSIMYAIPSNHVNLPHR